MHLGAALLSRQRAVVHHHAVEPMLFADLLGQRQPVALRAAVEHFAQALDFLFRACDPRLTERLGVFVALVFGAELLLPVIEVRRAGRVAFEGGTHETSSARIAEWTVRACVGQPDPRCLRSVPHQLRRQLWALITARARALERRESEQLRRRAGFDRKTGHHSPIDKRLEPQLHVVEFSGAARGVDVTRNRGRRAVFFAASARA
jgi:hypothetical protein